MRKCIINVLLCVIFAFPVTAQDTIFPDSSCYLTIQQQPAVFVLQTQPVRAYVTDGLSGGSYDEFVPTEETTVYGIALTAQRPDMDKDSSGYTVYLYTVGDSNRMVCLDSVASYSRATQFMYAGRRGNIYAENVVPCYEYYFSRPHVISAGTVFYVCARWDYSWMHRYPIFFGLDDCFCHYVIDCNRDTLFYAGTPGTSFWWGGIMPIIKRHCDSCPDVQNVSFLSLGNGTATVQWDSSANHQEWMLCYGPHGFVPDSTQAILTIEPQVMLNDLSDTAHYDVYIRAHCECCPDDMMTDWTGPIDLCLSTLDVDDTHAPEVTLAPNPTTGILTVSCKAAIMSVKLYDMQGRAVLTVKGLDAETTIDLSTLPKGTYTAVIHTSKGTATKQVVVL